MTVGRARRQYEPLTEPGVGGILMFSLSYLKLCNFIVLYVITVSYTYKARALC